MFIFINEVSCNEFTFIFGDTNIGIIEDKVNNDFLDLLAHYGFRSFISIPTGTSLIGNHSYIDHIFIRAMELTLDNVVAGITNYRSLLCNSCNIFIYHF